MVRSRWSASRDLVDALEELADSADLVAAQRDGSSGRRGGRALPLRPDRGLAAASCAPRSADRAPASAKTALLHTLLGGRAEPATERLVTRLVTAPRGRSLEGGLESLSKLAAARRDRMVAVVTSAVPLSDRQKQRLGAALAKLYGRRVHLNLDVDPEVLGGVTGSASATRSSTAPWPTGSTRHARRMAG